MWVRVPKELEALRNHSSVPSEIKIDLCDQWIPVSVRYPVKELVKFVQRFGGDDVEVIVMLRDADVATTLYYDGHDFCDDAGETYDVVAWMPLPEISRRGDQLYDGE